MSDWTTELHCVLNDEPVDDEGPASCIVETLQQCQCRKMTPQIYQWYLNGGDTARAVKRRERA